MTGRLPLAAAMAAGAAIGALVPWAGLLARWLWGLT